MYGAYIKRKEKEDINHEINPLFIIYVWQSIKQYIS